jgi:PPP family 3-phenylpropionic acid transporter
MYGVAYGLGGFLGALIAGWVYGEFLFVYSAVFALVSFIALFFTKKESKINFS